jgi:quercetin dioxygenase-like cupin family protein
MTFAGESVIRKRIRRKYAAVPSPPVIARVEQSHACRFGDLTFTTVLAGAFAGGVSLFEVDLAPGCLSGPLHVHEREDAVSYVLEGALTFQVGEDIVTAVPGSAVIQPRGVPHTFWNAGTTPAKALDIATPGGLEHLYQDLASAAAGDHNAAERVTAIEERYGVRMDWDSLPTLLERYRLRFAPE